MAAWPVEGVPELESLEHTSKTFVRVRARQAFALVQIVDHCICDSSRLQHVTGAQEL